MLDYQTLIRDFDHGAVAELDEYRAAARALDRLARAMVRKRFNLSIARWLDMIRDLTASLPLLDAAPQACCRDDEFFPPTRVVIENGYACCAYACDHGEEWECGWALDALGRW